MSGNQQDTKIQKWMKSASDKKLGKITENKKYNQQTVDIEEFMIELDYIEAKQEKASKFIKNFKDKIKKNETPHESQNEIQNNDGNQDSQKGEKQNSTRQRGESISDFSLDHKVMIIEDDSDKKASEEEKVQKKTVKQIIIQKKWNGKPKAVCDACVQTTDTSDVDGCDILKLIQMEQHFVFTLHEFHEKLLKLLDNQI
ncbi:hypothetical protein FGO68_gene6108 [Halteria grandinella]|uniref:Uncharacterized protein n=1 Tax=Halteria grandinella TaxID=5974 RepID=A0A8J8NFV5_HALGN|nr:hypothetical protein FGO68_gene6108 [Halteria grandinella]